MRGNCDPNLIVTVFAFVVLAHHPLVSTRLFVFNVKSY